MTPEQRAHLMEVYLTRGFTAAKSLAIQFGVSPKVMSKWARKSGHKGKRGREFGIWKTKPDVQRKCMKAVKTPRKKQPRRVDRRWKWAIERGAVQI